MLQAESRELLEGVARVAAWTAPRPPTPQIWREQHRRARELLAAYRTCSARDRSAVEPIVRAARDYARVLRRLGVRDPWALELEPVRPGARCSALAPLALAAPVALLGAMLGWIPYRLAGQVAERVTREEDVLGTIKLLAGALFLFVFWVAEAMLVGWKVGARWGALAFLAGPACGYVALRFDENPLPPCASRPATCGCARPAPARCAAWRIAAANLAENIARALRRASEPPRGESAAGPRGAGTGNRC